mgnify:CR=1 FL=1
MKKLLTALLFSISLAGCAAISNVNETTLDAAITYSTLKVIERDNGINSNDIIGVMNELDAVVTDEEVAIERLRMETLEIIGYDSLSVADRFLVAQVLDNIEDEAVIAEVKTKVLELCSRFPVYG